MFPKPYLLLSSYLLPIYFIGKPGILRDRHAVSRAFVGRSYTWAREELGIRKGEGKLIIAI